MQKTLREGNPCREGLSHGTAAPTGLHRGAQRQNGLLFAHRQLDYTGRLHSTDMVTTVTRVSPAVKWVVPIILLSGLILRLAVLAAMSEKPPVIWDERDYQQLAVNVSDYGEFSFTPGQPTSSRPPLYPAMMAAVWRVTGTTDPQVIRSAQILLHMALACVVYLAGISLFSRGVGTFAAIACWWYPSLVAFDFFLLTELLFTVLLVAGTWLTIRLVQSPSASRALLAGALIGVGALARSVLWPYPLLLAPLLFWWIPLPWRGRLATVTLLLGAYAAVVLPWSFRNLRVQHAFVVVDVLGGYNLRMGNYEHTLEDRMWDTVALTGEKNWSWELTQEHPGEHFTDGQKEKWAQRKALTYMAQHPVITLRRSLIRFADFWGLEREVIAGFRAGMFTPPAWFAWAATAAIGLSYPLVALLAAIGVWCAGPDDRRAHILLLLPVLFITAMHTLVFGHSRYHLPLVPFLLLYAAAAVRARSWTALAVPGWRRIGVLLTVAVLVTGWTRQVLLVDADRLRALFEVLR